MNFVVMENVIHKNFQFEATLVQLLLLLQLRLRSPITQIVHRIVNALYFSHTLPLHHLLPHSFVEAHHAHAQFNEEPHTQIHRENNAA